ncbi:hypothetical protein CIG19_16695 [Enterobacterales bacterium CwR94]|nr:hypothetical protein CIG19_16695 [Enterobacterales bacterium CwR94]
MRELVNVPRALTAENGAKAALSGEFKVTRSVWCTECGGEGCTDCNDRGEWEQEITIPWPTIKEIYAAAIQHFESQDGGDHA